MSLFQSSNPAMSEKVFTRAEAGAGHMTVNGAINKTAILGFLLLCPALYTYSLVGGGDLGVAQTWAGIGGIGGFIVALITIFSPKWSPITAPIYAMLKGLMLGAITAFADLLMPGVGIQAILLTLSVLFCMLMLYRSGVIKVTEKFKAGVGAALGAVFLIYIISFIGGLVGFSIPYIHGNGMIGIGFSLFVVGLGALMLVLDFDFIEKGAQQRAPKYMEWYGAFGLMVTLIWLYIEILQLLMKLQSRD